MVARLFGTDGVRGRANEELTPELALSLGRAASRLAPLGGRAIIGRDTRTSGPMLEGALAAGFAACGIDALLAGIIPTPAISYLIKDERADLGAVISASHNPPEDNGIKFFDRRGMKLSVEAEEGIESALSGSPPLGRPVGRIEALEAAASRYAAFLVGAIEGEEIDLAGRTIVVDCAYGATGAIAPRVLRHFGARVLELHTACDGARINVECGSTHLEPLRAAVVTHRADLGIAFDGDGDRVLLVSSTGATIDGDQMMGVSALHFHRKGTLRPPLVVATVMTNLGLEQALAREGISLLRTPVGDRNVALAMLERGAKVGGEQSGHVIFADHSVTGDGILTVVKLLEIAQERGEDLARLAAEIPLYPQCLCNVAVERPAAFAERPAVRAAIGREEGLLGSRGRLLVRPSGTQAVVRVLVEGEDKEEIDAVGRRIVCALEALRDRGPGD